MKNAALIPSWQHEENNGWFFNDNGADEKQPRYYLKKYFEENGVNLNTSDLVAPNDCDGYIIFNIARTDIRRLLKLLFYRKLHKTIYYPIEPSVTTPIHEYNKLRKISKIFGKVLTWDDSLVDNRKFFKLPIPIIAQTFKFGKQFSEKKLVTMISGANHSNDVNELYSKRIEAIKYFEEKYPSQFEFYGKRWEVNEFSSYRGSIENKHEVYQNFKFAICYENAQNMDGWVTEKIFDCFYSGIVPIYWGPQNIEKYIPSQCFIDKTQFESYEDLAKYLVTMTEDQYNRKIEAIRAYLTSDKYEQFTPKHFAKAFYDNLINISEVRFSYVQATINMIRLIKWLRFPRVVE